MTTSGLWTRREALGAAGAAMAGLALQAPAADAADAPAGWVKYTAGSSKTVDHSAWDALLKTHVVKGADALTRVAYVRFKPDQARLKAYIASLEAADVAALDRLEQFAFWANLYNAKTVDVVLDKYPVKTIKDINLGGGFKSLVGGGPWQAKILKVAGLPMSLDDIENVVMRPTFKDPRVHYSINCASVGCPNLVPDAWTGAKLEAQLDAAAKAFVNSPRGIRFDGNKAIASSIYTWFAADFGGTPAAVIGHLQKYAEPALKARLGTLTTMAYDYDWSLADAK
jgi:Protein of unknown function, DUF547